MKLLNALLNRKRYTGLSWFENFMGGHVDIGPITIFGENAMHWGVTIRTKTWGYVCFRLPFRCFGCWLPLYFYISPNATPGGSTFYAGPSKEHRKKSRIRRQCFGHNYDQEEHQDNLDKIHNS